MSEVKLDETYWKCDVCGERMPKEKVYYSYRGYYYGYWNLPSDRCEVRCTDDKATMKYNAECGIPGTSVTEKKPAVFTICDDCIERLMELKQFKKEWILMLEKMFRQFSYDSKWTGDRIFHEKAFTEAMCWLKKKFGKFWDK